MSATCNHAGSRRGFTLIEMLVVIVLASIVLALVIPSFQRTAARKRLEGAAAELGTDIQYARTEAVQRNTGVGVVFAGNCYVVYVIGTSDATNCASLGTGATALKTVQITSGTSLAFTSNASPAKAFIAFDPVRGMATDAATGATDLSGDVSLSNVAGNWQIQARVTRVGRVKVCSPNGTIGALATDCSIS
jgi:type IV fimbrial biogenesis protein FimT